MKINSKKKFWDRAPNFSVLQWKRNDEGGGRILLGENTGSRVVFLRSIKVPVCWSLDFNWTALYMHIFQPYVLLSSDLHRIIRSVNYSGSWRVTVCCIFIFCLKIKHRISLRIEPFWVITQRIVVIRYRRFGTTCRSHLRSSRVQKGFWILDSRRWDR